MRAVQRPAPPPGARQHRSRETGCQTAAAMDSAHARAPAPTLAAAATASQRSGRTLEGPAAKSSTQPQSCPQPSDLHTISSTLDQSIARGEEASNLLVVFLFPVDDRFCARIHAPTRRPRLPPPVESS